MFAYSSLNVAGFREMCIPCVSTSSPVIDLSKDFECDGMLSNSA